MKAKSYRLAQYKITENEDGGLWWESYAGIGQIKGGRCFIEGDILFIGASKTEESGYLLMEFNEILNQLPKWEKTKYYCPSYIFYSCKTGRMTRKFARDKESGDKIKIQNHFAGMQPPRGKDMPKSVNLKKAVVKFKETVVAIWGLFKDWLP